MKTLPSILLGLVGLSFPLAAQTVVLENVSTSSEFATSGSVSSFDTSGANMLVAIITTGENDGDTISVDSVSFGANAMTNLGTASTGGLDNGRYSASSVWTLANPTGTDTISASLTEAEASFMTVFALSSADTDTSNWIVDTDFGLTTSNGPTTISTTLQDVPAGAFGINGMVAARGVKEIIYDDSGDEFSTLTQLGGAPAASAISYQAGISDDWEFIAYTQQGDANGGFSSSMSALAVTAIPEPSTFALFAGALGLGLVLLRRRR